MAWLTGDFFQGVLGFLFVSMIDFLAEVLWFRCSPYAYDVYILSLISSMYAFLLVRVRRCILLCDSNVFSFRSARAEPWAGARAAGRLRAGRRPPLGGGLTNTFSCLP